MNAWIDNLPGPKLQAVIEKDGDALMRRHHVTDPHFALWLHMVDRAVMRRVHLGYQDLEDWDYASAYEGDMAPRDAAIAMLEDNGYDLPEGVSHL